MLICTKCDKNYKILRFYNKHIEKCTGPKRFICDICDKEFKNGKALYGHKAMQHGNKKLKIDGKVYSCKFCDQKFDNPNALGGHVGLNHSDKNLNSKQEYKCHICDKVLYTNSSGFKNHLLHHDEDFIKVKGEKISKAKQEFFNDPEKSKDYLEYLSNRMKGNTYGKDNADKISKSLKKYFKSLSDEEYSKVVENFINAPKKGNSVNHSGKYTPTKIEQMIIDLNIEGLKYNGNIKDAKAIRFKNKEHKKSVVPDFLYKDSKKVIETFGVYWHPREDEELYTKAYQENGYEVLILWEDELFTDFNNCKKKIFDFLNID